MIRRRAVTLLIAGTLALLGVPQSPASADGDDIAPVRGWTILSDSDRGADEVIAEAPAYDINHLQISHEIVHDLNEVKEPAKRAQANRLTGAAHAAGIDEVAVWDHTLYDLDYYPSEFRTGPGGTIDLDNPAFWEWFKDDYRTMLDLVPDIDSVVLTFIETGARVERQYSQRLTTDEQKLAYVVDQVADVVNEERGLNLYLRTFGYYPGEMDRTLRAIDLVENQDARVMIKAQPHDFFLTHPVDTTVTRIDRPVLVEYDATGEYNGQGKIANAFAAEHVDRMRYYQRQPNVIGYVARTDRYDESRIVGTPTELNLYALARADADENARPEDMYEEFAAARYGAQAAPKVGAALSKSYDIVTSVLYTLGSNSANHSRLDYDPYCSSWNRSVSGKWTDPPVTHVAHTVNREFHYWKDTVEHLGPVSCKISGTMRLEAPYVIDNGWVTDRNAMDLTYLHYVQKEKKYGVNLARSALRDIEEARPLLSDADYRQLHAYFERTVLTARLHYAVSSAYFGYRVYVQGPERQTEELKALIWAGLDEAERVAGLIRAYPAPAASGEWDWVRDAAEADKYHTRIAQGWDRYGFVAVPRPTAP